MHFLVSQFGIINKTNATQYLNRLTNFNLNSNFFIPINAFHLQNALKFDFYLNFVPIYIPNILIHDCNLILYFFGTITLFGAITISSLWPRPVYYVIFEIIQQEKWRNFLMKRYRAEFESQKVAR